MRADPSQELLCSLFSYSVKTGEFTRLINSSTAKAGEIAGHITNDGYRIISVNGCIYGAHRLAWIFVNGAIPASLTIDHVNGKRADNRIENLRLATPLQNSVNRKIHKNNRSGFKGVYFDQTRGKANPWKARIVVDKKQITLGLFPTAVEAHEAYKKAADKYFGEFAKY